ncbi:MAG: penicillin acylase family protein [Acidobacteriia bacterium]|nr:penicillin acylase family protein [Terriglobia bacterium]
MATATLAAPRRSARLLLRVIVLVLVVLLLAAAGACWWFYSEARASLPQLDGTLRLQGVSALVSVIRDAHGVPHIRAANMDDLVFAQAYVTAQDRLWQMDMTRRYIAGELAEVLGTDYVRNDRLQRTLGMRQVAQSAAASMSDTERRLLDSYTRGVNAYIDSHRSSLPIEFRVLGYAPRAWSPEDTFLIACMFNEMLNLYSMDDMLARERVLARLPADLGADLFPNTSWRDHPPGAVDGPRSTVGSRSNPRPRIKGDVLATDHRLSTIDRFANDQRLTTNDLFPVDRRPEPVPSAAEGTVDAFSPGSNNWVVSGAHTVSGKPLLSNDMHLQHHIPNVWHEVHLTAGDFDVAGVTAPGLPLVLVGHNRRIAWGFTNLGPAVTDLYLETFNRDGQYQAPDGWRAPQQRHELIHVKGKPDVAVDVVITRHGPIVTGVIPGETRPLALQWTLWDTQLLTSTFEAIRQVDEARNWDDFRRAASRFGGPGQNVVYADVDGHIGYQATGWVPLRQSGDATKPVPGNVDAYEWHGYVPFDQMPSVFDPESGLIGTANGRVAPDGYPHLISAEWMPPYRTERIYQFLQSGKKFSAADMLALQTDIYSDLDRFFAQRFAAAVDHTPSASPRARQAAGLMRNWDGRLTIDSVAPSIAVAARRQLQRLLLEPLLGPADDNSNLATGWRQYTWHNSSVWLENLLTDQPQRWLPKTYKSWDDLLAATVEQTINGKGVPRDLSSWHWGQAHPVYLQHPIFGRVPLLRRWTGPGTQPQSGDGTTVKQVGFGFGPSERLTVDFANLDASTLNIVTGQSGNFLSAYYMDQWQAWYQGTTFPLPFSPDAVRKSRAHEMRLEPK